ncbi:MAG: peptidoglycan DD-metalloendopeptidase family protein [Anaerolineae bacterium]|nr:peptidoglycan DD-metalloendopeptidase family protein [Anaerolineae bacterium]
MGLQQYVNRRFAYVLAAAMLGGAQFFAAQALIAVNDPARQVAQTTATPKPPTPTLAPTPVPTATPWGIRLPFDGKPRLTSYFDHNSPNYNRNGRVTIYTGDSSPDCSPYCYDGHSGLDYGMVTGTPLLAAADGTVIKTLQLSTGYGIHVVLRHANNYYTLYAHMSEISVQVGQTVKAGTVVGLSGNTGNSTGPHLHFGVYRVPSVANVSVPNENYATDPFGWLDTTSPDPLINHPTTGRGAEAVCLWRSDDKDEYHCNDVIIEDDDAKLSAVLTGDWKTSNIGLNGSHYISNTEKVESPAHASWKNTIRQAGLHRIEVFVPSQNATTRTAKYRIYTGNNVWQEVIIDQLPYNNEWVTLGVYELPVGESHVWLSSNTDEPNGTTRIAADAIRYRRLRSTSFPKPVPSITPTANITPTVLISATPTVSLTVTISPTRTITATPVPGGLITATATPTSTPTSWRLNLPLVLHTAE